jgi:RNA polymerase sigma-70 factor (sigma-E family)
MGSRGARGRGAGGGVAGEEEQFQEFFADQYGRLRRLGYWLTGDWGHAEELTQEALVRTWWRWPVVRRLDRPADYPRRVLINLHRSLRRRALVEARYATRIWQPTEAPFDGPEDALVLAAALRRLSPRQRVVVVLRYQQDLPEAEVARLLRVSVGTVKANASRGLARLRDQLGPAADELTRSAAQKDAGGEATP